MNNKNNDSDSFTAEKLQSTYPQITAVVNDTSSKTVENSNNECAPKISSSAPSKIPVTLAPAVVTKPIPPPPPIIRKSISPAVDRKVPPYTATLPNECVRPHKPPVIPTTFIRTVVEVNSDKFMSNKESTITRIASSISKIQSPAAGDVKKTQNVQLVRAVTQTTTKPADKVVVSSTTTSAEESKPSSSSETEQKNSEKVTSILTPGQTLLPSRTSDAFEKNLQAKVLSVTRNTAPNPPQLIRKPPLKDAKPTETNAANISISKATTSICRATTSTTVCTTTIATSTTHSPSTVKSPVSKPVVLSNENPNKNIPQFVKSVSISKAEPPKTASQVALLSPKSDSVVRVTSPDSSAKTKSPFPSVSSSPKPQAESFTVPPSPTIKNLKPTQPIGNLQLNSLSEVEKNKDIIKAINSGSTASIGENVTISSAPVEYVFYLNATARAALDPKIRNVSNETTIEAITQIINPGSPILKNKNGNPTENMGQPKQDLTPSSSGASSPGEIRTPKRCEIPGLTEDKFNETLKKKIEEPECLTISSDEEEESEIEQFISSENPDVSVSILNKEPQIERDGESSSRSYASKDGNVEKEADLMLETASGDGFTNLICRTVRIGSYKTKPRNGVTISKYGLKIVVPPLNNSNDSVAVKIPIYDIVKVLVHYNRSLPVIFYYITPNAGAKIRHTLKMHDSSYFYFDPKSPDESHRRITLLPEKFTEDDRCEISSYYLERGDVLVELNHVEANALLVRSAPKEVQKTVRLPPNPVQTIMVYPPPPAKGGISINTEDYSCLAEDTYLNDVIIDFYLKYLYQDRLSEEDRQKTHIFSSFFYKRLTDKATPVPRALQNSKSNDTTITKAEVRHDRVKKWTKNIDIFSKDYIVIPLNENQHWFLAIICFPGLTGPVRFSDNTPIKVNLPEKSENTKTENSNCSEKEAETSQTRTIGSTTITPISGNSYSLTDEEGDVEDRDEADGADEDVDEIFSSEGEESDDFFGDIEQGELVVNEEVIPKMKPEKEPIKQPCILIFDSLKSTSRARIIATLRQYLHVEYKTKHNGEERDFSKNVVKGACPRVPQQNNYTDCGLFVLHYVEMFFDKKIEDFSIPIRMLHRWFDPRDVSYKRYTIQKLLLQLMHEQKINVDALQLPELHLSPRDDSDYDDSEECDEYEYEYRRGDDDDDDASGMEHMMYEDDADYEEHETRMRRFMTEEDEDIDVDDYLVNEEDVEDEDVGDASRFAIYDSADDESVSNDNLSDDDDAYRGLDELDENPYPNRLPRTYIEVTNADGSDGEEIMPEEEEEEVSDQAQVEDHERRFNNINKENVTISRMPALPATPRSGPTETKSQPNETSTTRLEQLKAARPLKKLSEVSIERATEDDCPSKKFKSNSL